ncbi:unnamed protein product [Adineta ricciae]|uniref:Uncharacterized protein n=1 Tax=Adineta ricciae TaxID=249248 RepID=A0A816ALF7_ADIRI|nr:unnamed protein product [Adineta ricciae]CAF1599070.1 unnamed protein product [Adineta ricciae]
MTSFIHACIFILCVNFCLGLQCTYPVHIQLSAYELTLPNIEARLNNLRRTGGAICEVHMEFDCTTRILSIEFKQSTEAVHLRSIENVYIHTMKSFISDKSTNQTTTKTIIDLLCYSNDRCDQKFILEYFSQIIRIHHSYWTSIIRPLLTTGNSKKDECMIGIENQTKLCPNKACSWYYSTDTKFNEGKCENIDDRMLPMLKFNIIVKLYERQANSNDNMKPAAIRAIFDHSSSIQFSCKFSNCNSQYNGKLIQQVLQQHDDFWKMYKVCSG